MVLETLLLYVHIFIILKLRSLGLFCRFHAFSAIPTRSLEALHLFTRTSLSCSYRVHFLFVCHIYSVDGLGIICANPTLLAKNVFPFISSCCFH